MTPTKKQVEQKYGPITAELYEKAKKGKLTPQDIYLAQKTEERNEPLKPIRNWKESDTTGAAEFFVREIDLDFDE